MTGPRAEHVTAEIEGMQAVPDGGEPWATRLDPPHPTVVARAAGALTTVTASRGQAYKIAYTLYDAGLLIAGPAPAGITDGANPELVLDADPGVWDQLRGLETGINLGTAQLWIAAISVHVLEGSPYVHQQAIGWTKTTGLLAQVGDIITARSRIARARNRVGWRPTREHPRIVVWVTGGVAREYRVRVQEIRDRGHAVGIEVWT